MGSRFLLGVGNPKLVRRWLWAVVYLSGQRRYSSRCTTTLPTNTRTTTHSRQIPKTEGRRHLDKETGRKYGGEPLSEELMQWSTDLHLLGLRKDASSDVGWGGVESCSPTWGTIFRLSSSAWTSPIMACGSPKNTHAPGRHDDVDKDGLGVGMGSVCAEHPKVKVGPVQHLPAILKWNQKQRGTNSSRGRVGPL